MARYVTFSQRSVCVNLYKLYTVIFRAVELIDAWSSIYEIVFLCFYSFVFSSIQFRENLDVTLKLSDK